MITYQEAVQIRVAAADQQHLVRRLAGTQGARGVSLHPWYQTLAQSIGERLVAGTMRICPHLGPHRGFGPMYCTYTAGPMELQCRECVVAAPPRLSPIDENTCDRCNVYSRAGLRIGMLPVGPLLIGFGLCEPCSIELGASRAVN